MNDDNLKTLTPNEAREIGRKGGVASGQARRERKALKEQLLLLLENGDIQENICVALLDRAQKGDIKAFEVIRDTIGEKPTDKIQNNIEYPQALVRFISPEEHEATLKHIEDVINDKS